MAGTPTGGHRAVAALRLVVHCGGRQYDVLCDADAQYGGVDIVTAWLREGRSPTVFIHTPDNASSLHLARRFHDEVRARLPELDPLPEPIATEPMTLF